MSHAFSYLNAFSRNIGWVTPQEQEILRHKRVAIAGLGGVGGSHLLALVRLGIGNFHIADFDVFDIVNFNRQAGASMSSLGKPKVEVMKDLARDINPELNIRIFPEGTHPTNLSEFFTDIDLYIDGLDFFAFSAREAAFAACAAQGIPAITAAPLGMGAALLNFMPGKMTFEEYFRLQDVAESDKAIHFLLGLSPTMLQRAYLADPSAVDLSQQRGPSTTMACQLCAGIAATEALKILLKRGKTYAAPHGLHFDAYRNKLVHTWRPWGHRNPLQRVIILVAKAQLAKMARVKAIETIHANIAEQILDLARWAPSGDNTQPWRFEIINPAHIVVHGFDTREHCVYDINGHPSHLAIGALLENIAIAASSHGLRADIEYRKDSSEDTPQFDIYLVSDAQISTDPLAPYIRTRSVQRRPLQSRPLTKREKHALVCSVGEGYQILWLEGLGKKWEMAKLLFKNAKLRLTMPEAYAVHSQVIEYRARYSQDRVPDQAVGLDPVTTALMRWVMRSWKRVEFFNTFLAGTLLPRIQLDLIPALACASHFVIVADDTAQTLPDYVAAGRAMQRFWLTSSQLDLQLQPEMTPLIFATYIRTGTHFSNTPGMWEQAQVLSEQLTRQIGTQALTNAVFIGRIGAGARPTARSTRLPLAHLMYKTA